MKVQSQGQGSVTVLVPHGPLVADELVELRRGIEAAVDSEAKRVVLDLADVPYADSAGIEMLLELCDVRLSPHRRPILAALSETCLEALELTDILPRLEVFDNVENALRACQK